MAESNLSDIYIINSLMIRFNEEYYKDNLYFIIKENIDHYILYYSVSDNILEARKKEDKAIIPPQKLGNLLKYLKSLKTNKKTQKQIKKELEEFVDGDGNFLTSDVPILDPSITPKKTMDQSVAMGRITNDPITRGYRTYYGESIEENDMSKAFGYEETKEMDGKETYEYLHKKLGLPTDEAKQRTKEFGKDPTGKKDKNSELKDKKGFITKARLTEREKILKMAEDIVTKKKNGDDIINKKSPSKMLKNNIDALINMAEREGISKSELANFIKK